MFLRMIVLGYNNITALLYISTNQNKKIHQNEIKIYQNIDIKIHGVYLTYKESVQGLHSVASVFSEDFLHFHDIHISDVTRQSVD